MFVLSSDNNLVALGRQNGVIRWVKSLPKYRDPEDRDGALFWTGPLLAGDRLIVASTDGIIMEVNPSNGEQIRTWETGDSVVVPPIISDGTLYILSEDGTLSAYR